MAEPLSRPAPWEWEWHGNEIRVVNDRHVIADGILYEDIAHLITASPDLLALAERYSKIVRDPDASLADWSALTGAFDRAIAKAKGGS